VSRRARAPLAPPEPPADPRSGRTALREAIPGKFTVKTRIGFDSAEVFDELLSVFARQSLDLLTVHGRTAQDFFSGSADWERISALKYWNLNRAPTDFDRTHNLWLRLQSATPEQRMNIITQLHYLLRQARLVRAAIALAALSVFFTALLIITLFLCAMLQLGYPNVVATLFICSMACLIASLTMFLADINLSLKALRIEVGSLKDKKEKD